MNNKGVRAEIKIIVVGNAGTGKTSFCRKWMKDEFLTTYQETVVVDFSYKIVEFKGYRYKVQLWDIGGQDKNVHIIRTFTRNVNGALILCDITDEQSFEETVRWKKAIDDCEKFLDDQKLPSILIQNKIDLVDENAQKNNEVIKAFQEKNEFDNFFKTSVKMGIGITESMDYLIGTIIERMEKYSEMTGAPMGQKKKRENANNMNESITTKEQTFIKLDSNRLISSRSKTKRSYKNYNNNNYNNNTNNGIYDYVPNCCE